MIDTESTRKLMNAAISYTKDGVNRLERYQNEEDFEAHIRLAQELLNGCLRAGTRAILLNRAARKL